MNNERARGAAAILSAGSNALGAVRSLEVAGVDTVVVATSADEAALFSRHPIEKIVAPGAKDDDGALVRALLGIDRGRMVLIPTSDKFVACVVRHRHQLAARFDLCVPPGSLAEDLIDKSIESAKIARLGIPMPRTVAALPPRADDLVADLGLPLIVKPRSFRCTAIGKNRVLRTADEIHRLYAAHGAVLHDLLAQEVVPGGDDALWVCNCTFNHRHELVAAFTFRRLRMSPAHFGVTSYAISETNERVLEAARAIGAGLRYVGPAMIELKHDRRDGRYRYIELNPRIGMCNAFDTACGVNNVLAAWRLARGEELRPPPALRQRDGVIYVSAFDDIYSRLKDGETLPAALRHYASNLHRPHVDVYFSWRDPAPALVMSARDARAVLRSVARRLAPGRSAEGAP